VDWFDDRGDVEWRPGATHCVVAAWARPRATHCVVAAWAFTCSLPTRNKEVTLSSMLRVLPVQPYDIMGSVLTDYVGVQLVCKKWW
jgi:hypothetical protein